MKAINEYWFADEDEVREGFWEEFKDSFPLDYERWVPGRQNDLSTDCRCSFVDWLDNVQKAGQVSEQVAQKATL